MAVSLAAPQRKARLPRPRRRASGKLGGVSRAGNPGLREGGHAVVAGDRRLQQQHGDHGARGLPQAHAEVDQGTLADRSEEHTSELQSLMRISYAVFCWKKKT